MYFICRHFAQEDVELEQLAYDVLRTWRIVCSLIE
jgi:hypothetical protein